jgi:hypothetical protein
MIIRAIFIFLGGPKAHGNSGRDDKKSFDHPIPGSGRKQNRHKSDRRFLPVGLTSRLRIADDIIVCVITSR